MRKKRKRHTSPMMKKPPSDSHGTCSIALVPFLASRCQRGRSVLLGFSGICMVWAQAYAFIILLLLVFPLIWTIWFVCVPFKTMCYVVWDIVMVFGFLYVEIKAIILCVMLYLRIIYLHMGMISSILSQLHICLCLLLRAHVGYLLCWGTSHLCVVYLYSNANYLYAHM
jgi:hypothetical protein